MNKKTKDSIYDLLALCRLEFASKTKLEDSNNFIDIIKNIKLIIKNIKIEDLNFEDLNYINIDTVHSYLTEHWQKTCLIEKCNNNTNLNSYYGKRYTDKHKHRPYKLYCSEKCFNKSKSIRQLGENNSVHKMTKEGLESMKKKVSISMRNKIKNGEFIPCVTNSWAGSKVELNINNKIIVYRSSWDAFYHLCNNHLEYEKHVVQYIEKDKWKNYIVDFIDRNNNILYEIKPDGNLESSTNKLKFKYAKIWCKNNGFEFKIISNDWFTLNYDKYKHLLNEQKDGEIILKRLKQFKNEN